jgi:hypothetical protein
MRDSSSGLCQSDDIANRGNQGGIHMSLQTHLFELERKHRALEDAIASAQAKPSTDELALAELKRKKLQLKDEINRLKIQAAPTIH